MKCLSRIAVLVAGCTLWAGSQDAYAASTSDEAADGPAVPSAHVSNPAGDSTSKQEALATITRMYRKHLWREPDAGGLETYLQYLLHEGKDGEWVASVLKGSDEGQRTIRRKRQARTATILLIASVFIVMLLIFCLKKTRYGHRWLVATVYVVWMVLLLETTIRIYLVIGRQGDFVRPEMAIQSMLLSRYVVSQEAFDSESLLREAPCRVLLLGASAIVENFGGVTTQLRKHLDVMGADGVQFYNMARASHTTHDSRFKYLCLCRDYPFDIVVIYHGINDVRANNCPDDVFRADYGHYAWYEELNLAEKHQKLMRYTVIPYATEFLCLRMRQKFLPRQYVPIGIPEPDWVAMGANIKTGPSFRNNIGAVVKEARRRSAKVILVTFAYYVPSNYDGKAFWENKLDYVAGGYSIDLWGSPSNVVRGIEVHNQITRELAARYDNAELLDMERLIPKEGRMFQDICHFSFDGGSDLFGKLLAEKIVALGKTDAPDALTARDRQ